MTRPYASPLRTKQTRRTHEQILAATAALLSDGGPEELSFEAVARASGTAPRTVYRHFATRDILLDETRRWIEASLGAPPLPDRPDDVSAFVQALFDWFDRNEDLTRAQVAATPARTMRMRAQPERVKRAKRALAKLTAGLDRTEARSATAIVQVLCSVPTWQTLRDNWGLDGGEAGAASAWAVRVLIEELRRMQRRRRSARRRAG